MLGGYFCPEDVSSKGDPCFEFEPEEDSSNEDEYVKWKGNQWSKKSEICQIFVPLLRLTYFFLLERPLENNIDTHNNSEDDEK
jgi:hypothetical protein